MNEATVEVIEVAGISVRTSNAREMVAETANIGALWESFYQTFGPVLGPDSRVFGVYTNYESDHNGEYDVVACTDAPLPEELKATVNSQILAGRYLVFSAKGEMPQAVIGLWGDVWQYFTDSECPHTRAYTTDFELYKGVDEVEIHIAIES